MQFQGTFKRSGQRGFSLIELMVSVALLVVMMLLVFQMLDETQKTFRRAKGMVMSFKEAREGFEVMNRTLSQATVNAYLGFDQNATRVPTKFGRQSDLLFRCGNATELELNKGPVKRYTHAVFFQAPLGYQLIASAGQGGPAESDPFGELDSLLNAWGYFVEFNSDKIDRPPFVGELQPPIQEKFRFRLMEFRPPAEANLIYQAQLGSPSTKGAEKLKWFLRSDYGVDAQANYQPMAGTLRTTRSIADNIIALIISPQLTESDVNESGSSRNSLGFSRITDIAPTYSYDTKEYLGASGTTASERIIFSRNQVPPILRVSIVAIDDGDFVRFINQRGVADSPDAPTLVAPEDDWFKDATKRKEDLQKLTDKLGLASIRYRIFSTNVRLREGNSNLSN
jgi:uncharacterized protein (TIGR02599 family)